MAALGCRGSGCSLTGGVVGLLGVVFKLASSAFSGFSSFSPEDALPASFSLLLKREEAVAGKSPSVASTLHKERPLFSRPFLLPQKRVRDSTSLVQGAKVKLR